MIIKKYNFLLSLIFFIIETNKLKTKKLLLYKKKYVVIIISYLFLNLYNQSVSKYQSNILSMFQNTYQSGFLSILYSIGSKPLQIWDKSSTPFFILKFTTDISRDSLIKIFSLQFWKLWELMLLQRTLHAQQMKSKLSGSSCLS